MSASEALAGPVQRPGWAQCRPIEAHRLRRREPSLLRLRLPPTGQAHLAWRFSRLRVSGCGLVKGEGGTDPNFELSRATASGLPRRRLLQRGLVAEILDEVVYERARSPRRGSTLQVNDVDGHRIRLEGLQEGLEPAGCDRLGRLIR